MDFPHSPLSVPRRAGLHKPKMEWLGFDIASVASPKASNGTLALVSATWPLTTVDATFWQQLHLQMIGKPFHATCLHSCRNLALEEIYP